MAELSHYELSQQDLEILIAQVREELKEHETRPPSPDDKLLPGLTWTAYLGLSEEEKGQIWDRLAADVPHSEELRIIEVKTRV